MAVTAVSTRRQRGGALMVSMVLIFMMSIMGISAMRSANLDRRMSTNAVHKSRTLQAAESATQVTLSDTASMGLAIGTRQTVPVTVTLNSDPKLKMEAEIDFSGEGPIPGWDLDTKGWMFRVTGDANLDDVSASSTVLQGFYIAAPN